MIKLTPAPTMPSTAVAAPPPASAGVDRVAKGSDGKRFDAHSLPPPSTATYQPQPGKRAALDLRAWQPSLLREAMMAVESTLID